MSIIQNEIVIQEDECYASYVQRLCNRNAINRTYARQLFNVDHAVKDKNDFNDCKSLSYLTNLVDFNIPISSLYDSLTEYSFNALFSSPFSNLRKVLKVCNNMIVDDKKIKLKSKNFNPLMVCKSCYEKDGYIRKSYNVADIDCCPICGNPLYKAVNNFSHFKISSTPYKIKIDSDYSNYVFKLYDSNLLNYDLLALKYLLTIDGHNIENAANKSSTIIKTIYSIYPNPDDFINLAKQYELKQINKSIFENEGYEVVNIVSTNLIELKCPNCGKIFCTTLWGFMNGFRCPHCFNNSLSDYFKNAITFCNKHYSINSFNMFIYILYKNNAYIDVLLSEAYKQKPKHKKTDYNSNEYINRIINVLPEYYKVKRIKREKEKDTILETTCTICGKKNIILPKYFKLTSNYECNHLRLIYVNNSFGNKSKHGDTYSMYIKIKNEGITRFTPKSLRYLFPDIKKRNINNTVIHRLIKHGLAIKLQKGYYKLCEENQLNQK